ncbi:MAG: hypothetical protein Kow00128_11440 [Deltaproteobacteria bacterium]
MNERGMRSALLYGASLAAAVLIHAALLLIPLGRFGTQEPATVRGVRLRMHRPAPVVPPAGNRPVAPPREAPAMPRKSPVPAEVSPENYSRIGGKVGGTDPLLPQAATGGGSGGTRDAEAAAGSGGPVLSEYGQYLARLRSDPVQGWAQERARIARRGWRGKGAGPGIGTGSGSGAGSGTGPGVGGGIRGGEVYLDPRVQMVVTSYPRTGIEDRFTRVPYPDLKFKRSDYTAGWWNVYIQIRTDRSGKVWRLEVLRPETDGPLERQFVEQVKREIATWKFDPVEAEILVDVRFYVE